MSLVMIVVLAAIAATIFSGLFAALLFRHVVSTNMVHIVQSRAKTTPYGTGQKAGNVYYKWPSWIPMFGVTVIELPVSNFDLSLNGYEAYDKDRVPFMIDVTAFFRINNTAEAAQRVASIQEMREQLELIVKGAVRKVLASDVIDAIMIERSKFGDQFTAEVKDQLTQWGVESVKAMELMDIRDTKGFEVIANIMAKKTSFIAMESRTEVASNHRKAETAEIEAEQAISVRKQESEQVVGERTAQKDKSVGIAQQLSQQEVLEQQRETREREMTVQRVQQVRAAENSRDEKIVAAEQDKATRVIMAEGALAAQIKEAEGIQKLGEARAAAEQAMQLAPVQANITLAKEIGNNEGYQKYLAMIEAIKAYMAVGGEQAKALQNADVKVIANAGQPTEGVKNVMDMFSSQGGTNMAAMVEAIAQTPMGEKLLAVFTGENKADQAEPIEKTEV